MITYADIRIEALTILREAQITPDILKARALISGAIAMLEATSSPCVAIPDAAIPDMGIKEAVTKAGGPTEVARACTLSHPTVIYWCNQNSLPMSEWRGSTQYALAICKLIKAKAHEVVHPISICPGAGQYMQQPDKEAV